MKKYLVVVLAVITLFVTAGCEKVEEEGMYKEGTYFASAVDDYGESKNTATAVLVVNKNGVIESLFLDTTYTSGDVVTTKKALGNAYNMKTFYPEAAGEWFEQVERLEKAVVEKQGLDGITLNSEGKTDSVSGCTIKIDALYSAIQKVLNEAK